MPSKPVISSHCSSLSVIQKGALKKIKSSQEPFMNLRCCSEKLTANKSPFLAIFCTGTRGKAESRERQHARETV